MDPPKKQLATKAKRKQPRPYQQIVRPEEKLVRIYKPREPRDRRYTAAVQLTARTRLPVLPTDIWRMVLKELVGPLVDKEGEAKEFRWAQAHLARCMRVNKVFYHCAAPLLYDRVLTSDLALFLVGTQTTTLVPGVTSKRDLCHMIQYINLEFAKANAYSDSYYTYPPGSCWFKRPEVRAYISESLLKELEEKHGTERAQAIRKDRFSRQELARDTLLKAIRSPADAKEEEQGSDPSKLNTCRTRVFRGLRGIAVGSAECQQYTHFLEAPPAYILDDIAPAHFCFTFHAYYRHKLDMIARADGEVVGSPYIGGARGYQFDYMPLSTVYPGHDCQRDPAADLGPTSTETRLFTLHLDNLLHEDELDWMDMPCLINGTTRILIAWKEDQVDFTKSSMVLERMLPHYFGVYDEFDLDIYIQVPNAGNDSNAIQRRQTWQELVDSQLLYTLDWYDGEGTLKESQKLQVQLVDKLPACDACLRS